MTPGVADGDGIGVGNGVTAEVAVGVGVGRVATGAQALARNSATRTLLIGLP
jgi:hypothetical protein